MHISRKFVHRVSTTGANQKRYRTGSSRRGLASTLLANCELKPLHSFTDGGSTQLLVLENPPSDDESESSHGSKSESEWTKEWKLGEAACERGGVGTGDEADRNDEEKSRVGSKSDWEGSTAEAVFKSTWLLPQLSSNIPDRTDDVSDRSSSS